MPGALCHCAGAFLHPRERQKAYALAPVDRALVWLGSNRELVALYGIKPHLISSEPFPIPIVREVAGTGERYDQLGVHPDGYLSYSPDGRMFAFFQVPSNGFASARASKVRNSMANANETAANLLNMKRPS